MLLNPHLFSSKLQTKLPTILPSLPPSPMDAQDGSSLRVASFSCYLDTAKESLVHRVSAQDNNISIKFSKNKDPTHLSAAAAATTGSLRVDSFSRSSDHNLLFQVPAPIQDPTAAFTFSHHHTPKHPPEIGVFGADRYFNMKLDYQTANNQPQPPPPPPLRPRPRPPTPTTPSLCSEVTSTTWNSQTVLLPNETKSKKGGASLFMGLGCRSAPCFDKKSVRVDEIAAAPAPAKNHDLIKKIQDLEESRRSIEVFGSRRQRPSKGSDVATNMERKLSMLTWDAIPTGRNNLPTSTVGSCDVASDASSDLFEIEDVSGTIFPLLEASAAGDVDDAASASGCMSPATSLYAPSEASIQWSVVTASAADYSAPSEFNDDSVSAAGKSVKMITRNHPVQVVQKASRPSGLLGCKSVKSVDVAHQNVCVKISKDQKNPN
ncbi:protein PHYTOCHROME KINASE SUBSTRATE 3-like [Salvia miltiorrhiza]|uniref:protein PHYTOCHROME KINASE SUBSTRATE 3-like n=1 Tax=Salvia miltiorrhiza TaxID=226208 RepID=UPI0025ACC19A|nr:protein PHYTOCHROME KINASE SUBSTRATE 3-like [Salvia miltiorrhiza]